MHGRPTAERINIRNRQIRQIENRGCPLAERINDGNLAIFLVKNSR